MRKIKLFDLFINLTIIVAIILLIIAIALTINDFMTSYEYETIDGEKGTAMYCINPYRGIPYCRLDDGTKLYGIKQYKKFKMRKNEYHYKNCCYSISGCFNGKRYKVYFIFIERKIKE